MVLFSTPSSTSPAILQSVSENLAKPGLGGIAIVVIGLVATFWIIETLIRKFSGKPLTYDDEPPEPPFDNDDE